MAEAAIARPAMNPLWLMPSAMTFVAFYQSIFDFGHFFVELCGAWLALCREVWARLFALAPGAAEATPDAAVSDLLTLWVCATLALWLFPLLTPQRDGHVKTTVSAVAETLRIPRPLARLLSFVLIAIAVVVVGAPFAAPPDADSASLIDTVRQSTLISGGSWSSWLAGEGVGFSLVLVVVGAALLSFVFFVIGPKLEAATLSDAERRDLLIIAIALSLISAAFVAVALLAPAGGLGGLTRPDAMALALLALIGLIAWRSALPFVQLSVLIGAVFVLDAVYRFGADVWTSVQGG